MTDDRFRLDGKTVLVTGGAGILGRALCPALAGAGARVVVADLAGDAATALADGIPDAIGLSCDITDPASVARTVNAAGDIDVLFNNAATKTADPAAFLAPFEDYDLATWRAVMAVNVDGMFLMAQAVGREMIARGHGGSIIQTGSIYGLVAPDPGLYEGSEYMGRPIRSPAVYSASKAAVIGLTRHLAVDWARRGIRVNCLVPGGIASGQNETFRAAYAARTPLGRMAAADDLCGAALYLASDASAYVTGQVLAVDGGWTAW